MYAIRSYYVPGIVPEEDLIGLYKWASLVVIPTLYEAGSGPLYEAMKYSTPVICSNVTSVITSYSIHYTKLYEVIFFT